jgi:HAD superfamily hydrolase (TIGR01509 family)
MLKGVIFDMDGVIVDSHPVHMRSWKKFLLSMGKRVADAELEFVREGRKKEEILRHFLGDLTDDQIQVYGYQKDLLFREEAQTINTIAGVRQLLGELNRAAIPVAVASCGSSGRVHHILDLLRLREYFATVVTGDDVTIGKPDPAIFNKAAEQLQVRPAESLVFEDCVSGVQAALAVGMKCLGIADGPRANTLLRAGADYVLPNFVGASLSQIQKLFTRDHEPLR